MDAWLNPKHLYTMGNLAAKTLNFLQWSMGKVQRLSKAKLV